MISATGTITVAGAVADPVLTLQNAVRDWVIAGSGLPGTNVIWADRGPVPPGTYIALRLIASNRVSDDWIRNERVGGGIVHHVRGTRHPSLEITCNAVDEHGTARPEQIVERVLAAIRLPTVRARMRRAQVGIGTKGPVRVIPGMRSMMFDPKATCEVQLHTRIVLSEAGSAIEHVEATTPGPVTTMVDRP